MKAWLITWQVQPSYCTPHLQMQVFVGVSLASAMEAMNTQSRQGRRAARPLSDPSYNVLQVTEIEVGYAARIADALGLSVDREKK